MNNALNEISIKTEFSYLIISKKNMVDGKFLDIKETLLMDFKKIQIVPNFIKIRNNWIC